MSVRPAKLTADLIESFAGTFLSPMYDQPRPTPDFHRAAWKLYCSDHPQAACIAPRDHAKSTALTHDYGLAVALFRDQDYIVLLGSSEDMAIESLGDITMELKENDDLIREFGVKRFITEQKTDIIVECDDGHQFRFVARGSEQKIRGRKWRGKRPGLILFDDIEDDEQVENKDRRKKFSRWFFRAAKQALRDGGKIRGHGTILHEDAMLARLRKNSQWQVLFYQAHKGFDDFSNILWPEKFPEEKLRNKRQELIDAGDSAGYSQEYLNDPLDDSEAYLRRDDFIPMEEDDEDCEKRIGVGVDFAVSKADMANRTSFTIGGKDVRNWIHFLDFQVGRWDPIEWIDRMFVVQERWDPECFWVEDGVIWKSVQSMVYQEMEIRDKWLTIVAVLPVKDKAVRGRNLQRHHRAGKTRWNTASEGYEGAKEECLRFTGQGEARLDDQFDSAALLVKGFDNMALVEEDDFDTEEEIEMERASPLRQEGRSEVTGY